MKALLAFVTAVSVLSCGIALSTYMSLEEAERPGEEEISPAEKRLERVNEDLSARLDALEARLESMELAAGESGDSPAGLVAEVARMRERLDTVEKVQGEQASLVSASFGEKKPLSKEEVEELGTLIDGLMNGDLDWEDSDAMSRFFELARSDAMGTVLEELEGRVAEDDRNLDARMELADAYIAKLMVVPQMERGVWSSKAEKEWKTVVEAEPDRWDANFKLGNNFSWYPAFLGKTDEAIEWLEKARTIQEKSATAEEHEETYARLAVMYERKKNPEKARSVLEDGLTRHPESEALQDALEGLGGE